MKKVFAMIVLTALCLGALPACGRAAAGGQGADARVPEQPPALTLVGEGGAVMGSATYSSGNYSWSWPTGADEYRAVEACGMGPTDPALRETQEAIALYEPLRVKLVWDDPPAQSVTVTAWDTAVYASESAGGEEPDAFLRDAALTETDAGERTLLLEPDRVYDIYAGWQEVNGGAFGNAHYYVITQSAGAQTQTADNTRNKKRPARSSNLCICQGKADSK